jgi:two-component system NarL family response regulator
VTGKVGELPGKKNPAMPDSPRFDSLRVLLVDDHDLFLEGLRNLLATQNIQVLATANDGLEALEKARSLRPDLILMDVQMPRCDGLAATRLIKAELPEIKIVMLTMSEDDRDLFEAVKSGASGYLLKKLKPEPFFALLADLQAGLLPFSPGLGARLLEEFTRLAKPGSPPALAETEQSWQEEKSRLSPRQMQILTLVAQGQIYRQVAETLGISEATVKYHMAEILDRLHLENRDQVIAYAVQHGLTRR